jgi:nuclear protein localization family protein 4
MCGSSRQACRHGHLLYAAYTRRAPSAEAGPSSAAAGASVALPSSNGAPSSASAAAAGKKPAAPAPWQTAQEEPVDRFWQAADGKIARPRDQKMCRHGEKAMCDYCMPLEVSCEAVVWHVLAGDGLCICRHRVLPPRLSADSCLQPYDAAYHAEHQIKHLSFNAYLRKQDIAMNKPSQSYIPPLEEADYSVKVPCPSGQHASWPGGICTKCQPSAITLQSQAYRMLDHVEFAHPRLIEHLLAFWRATGTQRFGFLLGRHEAYAEVPMGIKAVVEAIVEPPQEGELDGLTLGVPWEEQARVEALAKQCGLDIVGVIYTDLTPADPTLQDASKAGKVACKRHKDSFFLSGCEVLFAATLQQANASPSRFSRSGRFNSKFVTCVLSGTEDGAIDVSAYQISEQGMAMVKADMIEASVNPNIIRVRPSEGSRYVPEVFYRYKNAYKIDVKESAKPTFPVEYLLVTVSGWRQMPACPQC